MEAYPDTANTATQPAIVSRLGESWETRAEHLRLQEWELSQQLFAIVRQHLLAFKAGVAKKSASAETARLIDLASRFARRATGLADRCKDAPLSNHDVEIVQFEEALQEACSEQTATPPP